MNRNKLIYSCYRYERYLVTTNYEIWISAVINLPMSMLITNITKKLSTNIYVGTGALVCPWKPRVLHMSTISTQLELFHTSPDVVQCQGITRKYIIDFLAFFQSDYCDQRTTPLMHGTCNAYLAEWHHNSVLALNLFCLLSQWTENRCFCCFIRFG